MPDGDFAPEAEIERLFQDLHQMQSRRLEETTDQILTHFTPLELCEHLIRYYRLREIVQALANAVVIAPGMILAFVPVVMADSYAISPPGA